MARKRMRKLFDWKSSGVKVRGLRGLGSSPEVHTTRGRSADANAVADARKGAEYVQKGQCDAARRALSSAHSWLGHAVAHSGAGATGLALTSTSETLRSADHVFDNYCLRRGQPRLGDIETPLGKIRTPYLWALGVVGALWFLARKK